jgi:creatinine amidohydrolase
MRRWKAVPLVVLAMLVAAAPALSQKTVKDLKSPYMQDYCWMRLAEIVPEVTDRIILPIGTVESHGACPIGADNIIPLHLSELISGEVNALIAPPINHGFTGASVSQFPGSITVREEVFEEYIYDVLKHLVRTGFRNILIINGHGGNTEAAKRAFTRLNAETGARFMIVDWWEMAWNLAEEVYGRKPVQSGHGDLEEAAFILSYDPELVDREMYEKLGALNVGRHGAETGFRMIPAWATTRYPEEGGGHLDFDVKKAKTYTKKKADRIAAAFNEAVKRWDMMDSWK